MYTGTSYVAIGRGVEQRRRHVFANGSTALRTRTCRGCGCTTQRRVFEVSMCEGCSRRRNMRSYMPARDMAMRTAEVLYGLGGIPWTPECANALSRVPWLHLRMGEVTMVDFVCDAIGVSRVDYVDAETLVFR